MVLFVITLGTCRTLGQGESFHSHGCPPPSQAELCLEQDGVSFRNDVLAHGLPRRLPKADSASSLGGAVGGCCWSILSHLA